MKIIDIIGISIRNSLRSPLRVLLSSIAVAIGTASVILISSIGKGSAEESRQQLKLLGIDGLYLSVSDGSFDTISAKGIEENVENVAMAVPFDYAAAASSVHQRNINTLVFGTGAEPCKALDIELLYGRDITEADVENCEYCVIVGEEYAEAAYDRKNIVGKAVKININGISDSYTVIGVVSSQSERFKSLVNVDLGSIVYIPYTTMNISKSEKGTENIALKLANDEKSNETCTDVLRYIKYAQPENSGYSIQNITSYLQKVSDIIESAAVLITIVGGISLAVAVLGVMNSVFAGIDKQKYEIGLLLSVGAVEKDIRMYVIAQSIYTCLIGGIAGLLISYCAGFIMSVLSEIPYEFNIKTAFITEIITIFSGFISGVIPAYKASLMEPIDALRN